MKLIGGVATSVEPTELPDSIKANTKGLPPARAILARHVAWKEVIAAELSLLRAGRVDLVAHISRLETVEARHAEDKSATSLSILSKIRAGLPYTIMPLPPVANTSELPIAREALVHLDAEIEDKERLLDEVGAKMAQHARAAVREHGKALAEAYTGTLTLLRDQTSQLVALSRFASHGHSDKVVLEIAGFDFCGHSRDRLPMRIEESAINAARAQWGDLAARWLADPRAPADLTFAPHDDAEREKLVYDRLHPLERQLVDHDFAKGN